MYFKYFELSSLPKENHILLIHNVGVAFETNRSLRWQFMRLTQLKYSLICLVKCLVPFFTRYCWVLYATRIWIEFHHTISLINTNLYVQMRNTCQLETKIKTHLGVDKSSYLEIASRKWTVQRCTHGTSLIFVLSFVQFGRRLNHANLIPV